MKIKLRLDIEFAQVSTFLHVTKICGKIGQNPKNRHQVRFGAQFTSKHDDNDRIHQKHHTVQ